ncbi:amidohydrolase family protein [Arthrobacter sp. AZCC_0090]|uniref:amidohydrolase family protein n=1 Tax=Arthrobacter sp. AZCC_0090 TaxID=2735881 RepID=UPI001610F288|nr:amidohydrolase family protein [Arthrobacter sp. AZCC_0090]MBB6406271.1 putative amidohydrolase YtcJ [Arthrobacter sp. AZCC_0090]
MTGLLIRNVLVDGFHGQGQPSDVRVDDGVVSEMGTGLAAAGSVIVVDGRGGALLPGLCDHHLHLHAMAAAASSVPCGPPQVADAGGLRKALATAAGNEYGWVRGTGYFESVAGDLDAAAIDRLHDARPVRIQHRSGALWMLNTAAAAAVGLDAGEHPGIERDTSGGATGRLWRADEWLRSRLPAAAPPSLGGIGTTLSSLGITSVTDATPELSASSAAAIAADMAAGRLPQRVQLLGTPLSASTPGASAPGPGRQPTTGPYKVVIADSQLPALDDLAALIARAHAAGRPVAVHCVSRVALFLLLAALDAAAVMPGDRLEHAAVVPASTIEPLRRRGLRVVTQPGFIAWRGDDYQRLMEPEELPDLYRFRTLLAGGVRVGLSSDAPYGPLDPWAVMQASMDRLPPGGGQSLGPQERVTGVEALAGYLSGPADPGGAPRQIRPGGAADLVLLHCSKRELLAGPDAAMVRMTVIAGEPVFGQY